MVAAVEDAIVTMVAAEVARVVEVAMDVSNAANKDTFRANALIRLVVEVVTEAAVVVAVVVAEAAAEDRATIVAKVVTSAASVLMVVAEEEAVVAVTEVVVAAVIVVVTTATRVDTCHANVQTAKTDVWYTSRNVRADKPIFLFYGQCVCIVYRHI